MLCNLIKPFNISPIMSTEFLAQKAEMEAKLSDSLLAYKEFALSARQAVRTILTNTTLCRNNFSDYFRLHRNNGCNVMDKDKHDTEDIVYQIQVSLCDLEELFDKLIKSE